MAQTPTIDALRVYRLDNGAPVAWEKYVQGVSEARLVAMGINASDGAVPAGLTLHVDGVVVRSVTYPGFDTATPGDYPTATCVVRRAGQIVCGATLRDSSGQTVTLTETIAVCAYAPPALENLRVFRCVSGGAQADDGTCARVTCAVRIASVDGLNSGACAVAWRRSGTTSWTEEGTLPASGDKVLSGTFNVAYAYDVRLTVSDALRETIYYETLPPASKLLLSGTPAGDGVAFGMRATRANALELPPGWGLYAGGQNLATASGIRELLGVRKLLWAGTWASGSITVTGESVYKLFALYEIDSPVHIIAIRVGSKIVGVGNRAGGSNASPQNRGTAHLIVAVDDSTWTLTLSQATTHATSSPYHRGDAFQISRIYGLI